MFTFDIDAALEKAGSPPANPANPANPEQARRQISNISNISNANAPISMAQAGTLAAPSPGDIETKLASLIDELASISGDFTAADRQEALAVAMNGDTGPYASRDYLRDVLIPETKRRTVH